MSHGLAFTLTLTWLGVAGWQLDDGKHVVVTDPYFTRPKLAADAPLAPDLDAIAAHEPARADLILIGHSHYDHLLDAPTIALHTGAQILGSPSTAHVARAAGVAGNKIITVKGGEDYGFTGFSVRVIPSLHSALDDKHYFGGDTLIPEGVKLPMPRTAYLEGGTLAYLVRLGGQEVLILDTANYVERELEGIHPDVAIVATGLREEVHDYACRLMKVLGRPKLVLASHFDDFHAPPGTPLDEGDRAELKRFADEIHACSPKTRVVIPEAFKPLQL